MPVSLVGMRICAAQSRSAKAGRCHLRERGIDHRQHVSSPALYSVPPHLSHQHGGSGITRLGRPGIGAAQAVRRRRQVASYFSLNSPASAELSTVVMVTR